MRRVIIIFGLFMLLLVNSVIAQNETQQIQIAGSFIVDIPVDWEITSTDGIGIYAESEFSEIRIRHYDPFTQNFFELELGDRESMLRWLVTDVFETRNYDENDVITILDGEAIEYTFQELVQGEQIPRTIFVKSGQNNFMLVANLVPLQSNELNSSDVDAVRAVVESFSQRDEYHFYEGTTFSISDGWEFYGDYNSDFAYVDIVNNDVNVELSLWPGYAGMAGLGNSKDFYTWVYDGNFLDIEALSRAELEDISVAGFEAVFDPVSEPYLESNGLYAGLYIRALVSFVLPNNSAFVAVIRTSDVDTEIEPALALLDGIRPGRVFVCPLFAEQGTRLREEPTTSSSVVREIEGEEILVGLRLVADQSGYTWFDTGEGYIRSDVIYHENSACSRIPGN